MKWREYEGLDEYIHLVEKPPVGEIRLYRGQSCNDSLLPKIARQNPSRDTTSTERHMLRELRRRGTLFLPRDMASDWDLLVYAQHYGMATRLLDWTSNPLAGLWFACSDADAKSCGYVYVLDVAEALMLNSAKERDPFTVGRTRVFKPNLNNVRIVAQSGWFTAHRYAKADGRFVGLERNKDIKDHLIEFEIVGKEKHGILKILDALGINNQSLFPEIHGVCRHVNWLYGIH